MARGFLAGVIWGGGIAGAAAVGLSVTGPPPGAPVSLDAPETPETEVQAMAEPAGSAAPEQEGTPAMRSAPEADRDAPAAPEADAAPDTAPEAAPDSPATVNAGADAPGAPEAPDSDDAVVPAPAGETAPDGSVEAPLLLPGTFEAAPEAPQAPADVSAQAEGPEEPGAPEAVENSPAAPAGDTPGTIAALPAPTEAPSDPGAAPDTPDRPAAASEDPVAPDAPEVPENGEALASESDDAPRVTALVAPPGAPDPEAAPDPATEPAAPIGVPDQAALRPSVGQPAGSLIDRDRAVPDSRLPRIGAPEDAPEAEAAPEAAPSASPLTQYAAEVQAPADVPRMAFVLIDDGTGPLGPEALESFPFAVSFAIAPGHPDPAQAAQAYRERGFEILAVADLPEGATAADVEVNLTAILGAVPEAVAVIEGAAGGLQSSREVSEQTSAFLTATGHGLLMMPKGLNTAQKLALKEGVPSASVFRDLDSEGQDQSLIRRTLDQSAFRARQEGAVVLLGRLRADTISALLLWGLQDRGNEIALVPVSTVLRESVSAE